MKELKRRNLFFVDSLTSPKSVAYRVAKTYRVPTAKNQIFLDNSKNINDIKKQIRLLARIATRRGATIGIGHAHPTTTRAIHESLPMLQERGIQLVFASQLVQ